MGHAGDSTLDYTIEDLAFNTTYHVRVRINNGGGNGQTSDASGTTGDEDFLLIGADEKVYPYSSSSWGTGTAGPTGSSATTGIAIFADGQWIVVDNSLDKFYRYLPGEGGIATWDNGTAFPSAATNVTSVAIDHYGGILVLDDNTDKIYRYFDSAWDSGTDIPAGEGSSATGLAIDHENRWLVCYSTHQKFYRKSPISDTWDDGTDMADNVTNWRDIAVDEQENIFAVSSGDDKIFRYNGSSWDTGFAVPSGESLPLGLCVDWYSSTTTPPKPTDILAVAGPQEVTISARVPPFTGVTKWQYRLKSSGGSWGELD